LDQLKELSEDDKKVEQIVNEQMIDIIRMEHPEDYDIFVTENKAFLDGILMEMKSKYMNKLKEKATLLTHPQV